MRPSVNTQEGVFTPDNLIAGDFPVVTDTITIAAGQVLQRGAVLGKITASGKYVLSDAGATDGSQTPVAILAEDVDASSGDKEATVYLTGEFNVRRITFGNGHTAATVKDALRQVGIFIKNTVGA